MSLIIPIPTYPPAPPPPPHASSNSNDESFSSVWSSFSMTTLNSPDKLLAAIGSRNRFLLFIWIAMALVWAVGALPVMMSAFLMDDFCANKNAGGNGTEKCAPQKGTVTEEFNLTDSSQSFLTDLSTSAYIAGMAVGSIIVPFLADKHGRRPALLLSLFISGSIGICSAFSPNIYAFIGMRFAQGLSFSGCILVNWVLAYESIPLCLRSRTALLFGLMWVFGYCLVAPMAYLLATWRQLIAAASAPSLLLGILYFFTIPESLHFLASQRRNGAIRKWIKRANKCAEHSGTAKISEHELDAFLANLEKKDKKMERGQKEFELGEELQGRKSMNSFLKTLLNGQNWTMAIYLGVSVYLWTCDTFIYYGLSLFSTQLSGDRYVNFTLVALVEIPSNLFAPYLLDKMGRRLFTAFMHFLAAIAFLLAAILSTDRPVAFLLLWLLAKFAISSSFVGLFVYSSEVFPTVHRNFCMGICTCVSQASSIFAPTVRLMANLSPSAPMALFFCSSLLASMVTFILPETKGKELREQRIAKR